jgi:hypothetical protein
VIEIATKRSRRRSSIFVTTGFLATLASSLTDASAQGVPSSAIPDVGESIRIACYRLRLASSALYDACLRRERAAAAVLPLPDLASLRPTDAFTARVACMLSRPKGVVAFHSCLAKEVADAIAHPSPDPSDTEAELLEEGHIACARARSLGNLAYSSCLAGFARSVIPPGDEGASCCGPTTEQDPPRPGAASPARQ